jgi:hypothetical protein
MIATYESGDRRGGYLTFRVKNVSSNELSALKEGSKFVIEAYKERRSLDANAYFHVLVTKIAEVLKSSNTEVKNRLIREYGQYEYIDDKIPTYSVSADYIETMLNREDIHFKHVGWDGDRARLAVMRGSHTYNTAEMSHLIDGTVSEAKELGIETLPPEELKRMYEQMEAKYGDKQQK